MFKNRVHFRHFEIISKKFSTGFLFQARPCVYFTERAHVSLGPLVFYYRCGIFQEELKMFCMMLCAKIDYRFTEEIRNYEIEQTHHIDCSFTLKLLKYFT